MKQKKKKEKGPSSDWASYRAWAIDNLGFEQRISPKKGKLQHWSFS